ncbi:MAG: peptide chain release factor N(5)-glutamine methyltransferase [Clostridia bacterium]
MGKNDKVQIAGQAVIEGVMMRGKTAMAVAVRDEFGNIRIDSSRTKPKGKISKIPIIRGVVNLVTSLVMGTKILLKSAEVAVEDLDTSNSGTMGILSLLSTLLGIVLALGLFVFLPTGIVQWFNISNGFIKLLVEGILKTIIMIGYFFAVSCIGDVKKVFMYHGAEHKTIACYEANLELTPENAMKCSKHHDRCGTSFVVFVIIISIIVSMLFGMFAQLVGFKAFFDYGWVRALVKIGLLPFVAGICFELLMVFARSNFILFRPFKWLGKQMQKITTKEPTLEMLEVAIAAHKEVEAMDNDLSREEQHFPLPITLAEFKEEVKPLLEYKTIESDTLDWILCSILKVKRDKLKDELKIPVGFSIKAKKMLEECASGKPLQYVLGNTEFYGYVFAVNKDCLIPRMETELVCEQALKLLEGKRKKVLDLCCGSGCIGLTIALKTKNYVTCSDISKKALVVASKNAKTYQANVNIVCGDMFKPFTARFDLIVCNPPYIATAVIPTLETTVKDYEPTLALDGGADGLDYYRTLAVESPYYLYKDGKLVLEIGYDQAEQVVELLKENFTIDQVKKDYGGQDRIIVATVKTIKYK